MNGHRIVLVTLVGLGVALLAAPYAAWRFVCWILMDEED